MSGARRSLTGHERIMRRLTRWLTAGLVLACLAVPAAANDRVVYYHTDIAGSPVATTDAAGEVIWRESYAPYGKRLDGQVGADNQIWFTGKREERLLDLHYYGARWYDARLGRFLSPDPVGVREADIHSFNRYAYANNNPYIYTDPDGRVPVLALIPPALSLTGKALSVAGAALTGWTAGSNAYDVYTGEKTPGAAAQDAAIDIVIAATLKGTGAWLRRGADSLRAAAKKTSQSGIGVTQHSVQQKINRQVRSIDELDAIKNPLDVRPVKVDNLGRPSQRYIGREAEVARNPETGDIVSVNPTSTKKAEKLLRSQGGQ